MKKIRLLMMALLFALSVNVFAIETAPLNPDFVEYMKYRSVNTLINGHVPLPFTLASTWVEPNVKRASLPESYDLRDENRVSPIRDQDPWGTCWTFGATSSVESNVRTQNPASNPNYSEFNIVRGSSRFYRTLNSGGNYLWSIHYYTRGSGPINETSDPYITNTSSVDPNSVLPALSNQPAPVAFVENVSLMPVSLFGDPVILNDNGNINQNVLNAIKNTMMTNGALDFSYYHSNTYLKGNSYYCNSAYGANHEISIIGWDDNYSSSNFGIIPPGNGAFLARNSWGTGWGDKGYFWISYYDKTACDYASFNSVDLNTAKYDKIYMNDNGGWLTNLKGTSIARSRFIISENTNLKAVGTYVYMGGLAYNIKVYVNGTLASNMSGTFGYSGYSTFPLQSSIALTKGDVLMIDVNYDVAGKYSSDYILPIETYYADLYTTGVYAAGLSYIYYNGQWVDLSTTGNKWNTCIRALTKKSSSVISVTGVTLNKTTASIAKGATLALTPTIIPSNASNKNVTWSSSNKSIATVNSSGVVTGVAAGSANIVVTTVDGNKTATCNVTVTGSAVVAVTGVTLNKTTASIAKGATLALAATVAPSNASNKNVTWSSSNKSIATVNNSGVVTGVAAGSANIVVTTVDGGKTATCKVTITASNVAVTGVTLNKTTASIVKGATLALAPTIIPSNATNKNVTWSSSNTKIATVNTSGVVTGVATGSANVVVITVDGSKTATCKVTVTAPVAVKGVTLNKTTASIAKGATLALVPTITPSNATNKNVIWSSSNTSVATVSTSGVVKGIAAGSANIVVKTVDGNKTATCKVTVTQPVTGVTLNKTTASIAKGATLALTAIVAPSNATNKKVTWSSSNKSIATVSTSGSVKGVAAGSANILVTTVDGSKTAICKITVTQAVTGVTLNKTTASIAKGATLVLSTTVAPSNATNKNVTWSSSNASIATVSSTGVVKGIAAGSANIVVKTVDGNKTATCKVTVTQPVTGVTLNKTTASIAKGANLTLTATVAPSNAANKKVTWSSSNKNIASVSTSGVVKGVAAGSANIVVTTVDGSKTAVCKVTVTK